VERGLLGPREVPRLWDRHLLNCAAVGALLDPSERVIDLGSGAGLPGIPLAIARPSSPIDLVEPLQRRVDFLAEVVTDLSLSDRVRVIRGRVEDRPVRAVVDGAPVIVARAVTSLEKLVQWCLPLLGPGGRLLAVKGERAQLEIQALSSRIRRQIGSVDLVSCGRDLPIPTRVVIVTAREGR
jgi:16S rRNA (guanine527-N7)-methyltransferase